MSEHYKDVHTTPEGNDDRTARSGHQVAEQPIPHSGTLPEELREQPVRDFDKTSLPEAYEQGRIVTPDSPAPLIEHRETKKSKKGVVIGLGAGAAGLALAAGAVFGVNALAPNPGSEPTATAAADPSETPAEADPSATAETDALTVERLEIPAGLDAETLGKTIVEDRFSEWVNAAAEDSLLDRAIDAGTGWDTLLPQIADENKEVFADALFESGWTTDAEVVHDVDSLRDTNLSTLQWYVSTAWSGDEKPENEEGFREWMTVDGVTELSNDGTTRTIEVASTYHDNSDKNSAPAPQTSEGGTWTITTTVVNGTEKITALTVQ